jgi:hypothetical protein
LRADDGSLGPGPGANEASSDVAYFADELARGLAPLCPTLPEAVSTMLQTGADPRARLADPETFRRISRAPSMLASRSGLAIA